MNLLRSFTEKNDGRYMGETVKGIYSIIGKKIYQPKRAQFLIGDPRISVNLNEVAAAVPTAVPFSIMYLCKDYNKWLEL